MTTDLSRGELFALIRHCAEEIARATVPGAFELRDPDTIAVLAQRIAELAGALPKNEVPW